MAAIVDEGGERRILHVPLHRDLQRSLAVDWDEQLGSFLENVDEIDFDPGYKPEARERFCLKDYELPTWLEGQDSESVRNLDRMENGGKGMGEIRGLVGFAYDGNGRKQMLFQNSTKGRVVQPGCYMFLEGGTYRSMQQSALCLDNHLSAVYFSDQGSLIFQNFRTVNTFLPLEAIFEEASDKQMLNLLAHERLAPENPDQVVSFANQWFRKRFAMLDKSGVLDKYTSAEIAKDAKLHEVTVKLDGERIIFPADKQKARRLLQYLNEERFVGAITDTLYETNSKRAAS